jgi:hypothetical protein
MEGKYYCDQLKERLNSCRNFRAGALVYTPTVNGLFTQVGFVGVKLEGSFRVHCNYTYPSGVNV